MSKTSWVEICVSDFDQSINWFENVLGFRVVARDENEYAELRQGETYIQLASDQAAYWEPERQHLLAPGQRGSGVEIVLVVDNIDAVYRQAQRVRAEIVRPLADYPWHMRQFWVRHPDGYLIRPAQRLLTVNPEIYRRQVIDAFRDDKPRITQELLAIKQTADNLVQQQDYLSAATIYETLVTEIFDRSHLYYEEAEEYDDYDEYYEQEWYHPEEEGLGDLVRECVEALGNCLAQEQADRVAREKIIEVLLAIYQQDLKAGSIGLAARASELLVEHTTPLERSTIADWIRDALTDEMEEISSSRSQEYGRFLLALEKDTLDDETYLQICRETHRIFDLIDRLLVLGRVDEAIREAKQVNDSDLLNMAHIFVEHGQDAVAERLIQERAEQTKGRHLLDWLKKRYLARNDQDAALEVAETIFRTYPGLEGYKEVRQLATPLGRWETLRPELLAFVEESRNTPLLIHIALDEGDIDKALALLKSDSKPDYRYAYYYNIELTVAKAAEETRPRAAIEIYQKQAEKLIALRQRKHYQEACKYLAKVRALYEKLGDNQEWTRYITELRERHHTLRALKEEMEKAKLARL
ncbi:MAG: glyoxalase [Chloroflexi bacterium]|nr:MAG: glyoxalase [Chloroflexota bacterium]